MGAYYYDEAIRAGSGPERDRSLRTAEEWLLKGVNTPHYDKENYLHNMYRQLAMIQILREQYGRAEDYFLAAIKANDTDPEIQMDLGTLYMHSGRPEDAKRRWRHVTRKTPTFVQAWERLMHMELSAERDDEVQRLIEEAETRLPGAAFLNIHRGLLSFRQSRFQEAVGHFRLGLPYLPDLTRRWEQWLAYGRAAYSIGSHNEVVDILNRFRPLLPELPPAAGAGFGDLAARLQHGR
ncbi:MAG: tetratricopeptide repeat protein, partial [Planctomycetota bacterium]|jgi:tetratricopeptide (TPR) repeat protein